MCDKEDDDMSLEAQRLKNDPKKTKQDRLKAISSSIDFSKLPDKKPLTFDKNGVVNIDPSHSDYRYWVKDEE